MKAEIIVKPSDGDVFHVYYSLFETVNEESEPREGRVGWLNFDMRIYSIMAEGKIRSIVVYDRELSLEESIKYGLFSEKAVYNLPEMTDQMTYIAQILEQEKDWCESGIEKGE